MREQVCSLKREMRSPWFQIPTQMPVVPQLFAGRGTTLRVHRGERPDGEQEHTLGGGHFTSPACVPGGSSLLEAGMVSRWLFEEATQPAVPSFTGCAQLLFTTLPLKPRMANVLFLALWWPIPPKVREKGNHSYAWSSPCCPGSGQCHVDLFSPQSPRDH